MRMRSNSIKKKIRALKRIIEDQGFCRLNYPTGAQQIFIIQLIWKYNSLFLDQNKDEGNERRRKNDAERDAQRMQKKKGQRSHGHVALQLPH